MKLVNMKGVESIYDARQIDREAVSKVLFYAGYGIWLIWKLVSI